MATFAPIADRVQSLQQRARAHRGLLRFILQGSTPRTAQLESAAEMATALGVNRTAVREALAILASQGFVIQEPQRGFRVVPVTDDDIREVLRLRVASEVSVARTLARTTGWSSSDVDSACDDMGSLHLQLRDSSRTSEGEAARQESVPDAWLDFGDADNRFHVAMARAARFSTVARYVDTWRDLLRLYRTQSGHSASGWEDREAVLAEHQQVLDHIRRHDQDAAARAIEIHIANAMRRAGLDEPDRAIQVQSRVSDQPATLVSASGASSAG